MLASLILLGGALGDRLGRRRVFLIGVVWFAAASLLCGLAPNAEPLIAARVLQGIGGALLTPGSLAIIEAVFVPSDRGRAIGVVDRARQHRRGDRPVRRRCPRAVRRLALDLPDQRPASPSVTVAVALRYVPETGAASEGRFDVPGAVLAAV